MIDVSELIEDTDFAEYYQVVRKSGKFSKGNFEVTSQETLCFYGAVQPASPKELEQLPEGDRQKGVMKFFCKHPKIIRIAGEGYLSDEILWRGNRYKVLQVMPHGSWMRAFACLLGAIKDGTAQAE